MMSVPARPENLSARVSAWIASAFGCALLSGCVSGPQFSTTSVGELEFFLQQAGDACFATLGLRNTSDIRKGPAEIELTWYLQDGKTRLDNATMIDPIRVSRYSAKNVATREFPCAEVERIEIIRAEWAEFLPWREAGEYHWRSIDGVDNTVWTFEWRPDMDLFEGSPQFDPIIR